MLIYNVPLFLILAVVGIIQLGGFLTFKFNLSFIWQSMFFIVVFSLLVGFVFML